MVSSLNKGLNTKRFPRNPFRHLHHVVFLAVQIDIGSEILNPTNIYIYIYIPNLRKTVNIHHENFTFYVILSTTLMLFQNLATKSMVVIALPFFS